MVDASMLDVIVYTIIGEVYSNKFLKYSQTN